MFRGALSKRSIITRENLSSASKSLALGRGADANIPILPRMQERVKVGQRGRKCASMTASTMYLVKRHRSEQVDCASQKSSWERSEGIWAKVSIVGQPIGCSKLHVQVIRDNRLTGRLHFQPRFFQVPPNIPWLRAQLIFPAMPNIRISQMFLAISSLDKNLLSCI